MAKIISPNKILVFDADVIIHFIRGGQIDLLFDLFDNDSIILDRVYNELKRFKGTKEIIDELRDQNKFRVISIVADFEYLSSYTYYSEERFRGPGESACLAYCTLHDDVVASSNLSDIRDICEEEEIDYLTTYDFLEKAVNSHGWTIDDCESFISTVNSKGSRLTITFEDFLRN